MKKVRPRATYANIVSTLCLFLLLAGGGAYAAVHLPKNSVGTKQLKNKSINANKLKPNAITTKKIKKNAVTGAKINKAKLGAVPLAESLSPLEATHLVGAGGQPAFENGAQNYFTSTPSSPGFNRVGFYKDHDGIVHLQGIAEIAAVGKIFTLPAGFRPAPKTIAVFGELTESVSVWVVGSNGAVIAQGRGGTAFLDGITFRAGS